MNDILQVQQHGRVVRVSMNRPEKRNALNGTLCRELVDAVARANRDPQVGAIILAGNGPTFCAGMDLEEAGHTRPDQINNVHEQLFTLSTRMIKPLVAEVDGPALGGGLGLVANCHIAIASEKAKFGLTEIRLGLWPFLVFRAMSTAVGERHAVELALTGRIFDAQEAKEMGLVQQIAPEIEQRAMDMAEMLGDASPTAVRCGLSFVQEVRGKDWNMAGTIARRVRDEIFRSADFCEGIRAFREKRKPEWPSREERNAYPGERIL
jgi:enoyl-CoA hydratase/carnithine racemase